MRQCSTPDFPFYKLSKDDEEEDDAFLYEKL